MTAADQKVVVVVGLGFAGMRVVRYVISYSRMSIVRYI